MSTRNALTNQDHASVSVKTASLEMVSTARSLLIKLIPHSYIFATSVGVGPIYVGRLSLFSFSFSPYPSFLPFRPHFSFFASLSHQWGPTPLNQLRLWEHYMLLQWGQGWSHSRQIWCILNPETAAPVGTVFVDFSQYKIRALIPVTQFTLTLFYVVRGLRAIDMLLVLIKAT